MNFSQFLPRLTQLEKKNRLWSYGITLLLLIPFLLLSLIWTVHRSHYDYIDNTTEDFVGYMDMGDGSMLGKPDFGDGKQGNRDVNNFDPSVANPTPPAPNTSAPAPAPTTTPATTTAKGENKELTSTEESAVTVPDKSKDPKKEDKKPTSPTADKPKTDTKTPDTKPSPTTSTSTATPSKTPTTSTGGANSGKNGEGGNSGSPDIKHLDPDNMYSFGSGGGGGGNGLGTRVPLSLPKPKYDSQQEGKILFEFVISPTGDVIFSKVVPPIKKPIIEKAGLDAINKWKFSKSKSDQNQTVRVTITFKLKN